MTMFAEEQTRPDTTNRIQQLLMTVSTAVIGVSSTLRWLLGLLKIILQEGISLRNIRV